MSVVRSWGRALLGASGVTLLVPAGLVAAVAIAATISGTSGLHAVGQLFAGPELPAAQRPRQAAAVHAEDAGPAVPVRPRQRSARRAASQAGAGAGAGRSERRPAARRPSRRRHGVEVDGGGGRPGKAKQPARPAPTPPAATTPSQPAPPAGQTETNPVRRIGDAVEKTVAPLPVVGPPAADAVGTVIDLIAPPPSGSAPRAAAPAAPAPAPQPAPAPAPSAAAAVTDAAAGAVAPAP